MAGALRCWQMAGRPARRMIACCGLDVDKQVRLDTLVGYSNSFHIWVANTQVNLHMYQQSM